MYLQLRTSKIISILFLLIALPLPALAQSDGPGDQSQHVVFTKAIAEQNSKALSAQGIRPPYWTPGKELIRELEGRLPDYLKASAPVDHESLWLRLTNYKIQYVGYTEDESKYVYVRAFCRSGWDGTNAWLTTLISFEKGGDCFFHLSYDDDQSTFFNLEITEDKEKK